MSSALFVQVLSSFIIGGCFISFLSFLAEKAGEKLSGIIMMFPSTVVLGFFFLGLSTSPQKVAEVAPLTLTPLGIVIFSSVIYINTALIVSRYVRGRLWQILFSFIISAALWFVLAAPFAVYKIRNVPIGIAGYLLLISLAHIILNYHRPHVRIPAHTYTRAQVLFRAAFIGFVIAIVVFLAKTLSPFWAGLFTMFPALTLAAAMVFHYYYEPRQLYYFFKSAPLGSLSILAYILSAMHLFPLYGIWLGTLFSYIISMGFSLLLIRLVKK